MGRKSKAKDRGYITKTEWATEWGGYKDRSRGLPFRRLPFNCCAVAFTPFEDPVCTADGSVFDILNIVPYVQKFHRHPVSGQPLELRDLIRLSFHKNGEGQYHCPVLNKVFTEHTHIVAVRPTGNVYCYEALDELCIKPKNWKDLLDDTPFKRADIIHLQDPLNLSGRSLETFDHVSKGLQVADPHMVAQQAAHSLNVPGVSEDTRRVLAALGTDEAAKAFERGGGGSKAEALRALADAEAAAATAKKAEAAAAADSSATAAVLAGKKAPAAGGGGSSVGGNGVGGGGPDPRLCAPERKPVNVKYKPGTSTWDTDDPGEVARIEKGVKKAVERATGEKAAKGGFDPNAGRPLPQPYGAKWVESAQTTGAASRAFTSTVMAPKQKNERVMVLVERRPSKKGYMRLHTSLGDLNLELHCDLAPRCCENFMALAESGYYTGTKFHRSIKNFMIQGGDPTGTGKGGESLFGPTFKDELDSRLQHSGRGVISMANSGPNTNGSQFFILYKSAHHLDYKHSVFARVVGGLEVLTKMEKIPTDSEDRPLEDVQITGASIFVNPYKELQEEEQAAEEAKKRKEELDDLGREAPEERFGSWYSNPAGAAAGGEPAAAAAAAAGGGGSGVGRYLKLPAGGAAPAVGPAAAAIANGGGGGGGGGSQQQQQQPATKKQRVGGKAATAGFGNFDAW